MQTERVDFVTVPTRDPERARAFYHETLGLPLDPNNPSEITASQVTLAFWNPESDGLEFSPNLGGIALRVADVAAAQAELEAKRVQFEGTMDTGGSARVDEHGIRIERAPDGVTFEPLAEHPRLGSLVGADEKFAAHNAAAWQHGLLVVVPEGVELEQPLYVRVENSVEGGALF